MKKLGDLFSEVNQIILWEGNEYAVGFYNKNDSNSQGNTAISIITDKLLAFHKIRLINKTILICDENDMV